MWYSTLFNLLKESTNALDGGDEWCSRRDVDYLGLIGPSVGRGDGRMEKGALLNASI